MVSGGGYDIPYDTLIDVGPEAFDTRFGKGWFERQQAFSELVQIENFIVAFGFLHAGIRETYRPYRPVVDAHLEYLDGVTPEMSEEEKVFRARRAVSRLQKLHLADENGRFVSATQAFKYRGIDPHTGKMKQGGIAHKEFEETVRKAIRATGPQAPWVSKPLVGGGRINVTYKKGKHHIVFVNVLGEESPAFIQKRPLDVGERFFMQMAIFPLAVWGLGGAISTTVLTSVITGGTVGLDINTHGLAVNIGIPGTQWGPIGFGPSGGVRYGFVHPMIGDTPILPGWNVQGHLGFHGPPLPVALPWKQTPTQMHSV